jgi:hypothetical protein
MESRNNYIELTLTAVVMWTGFGCGVFARENQPPRLRRADCFLGAHFDFHAQMDDSRLGENTTEKMVNAIIDTFHPDYIEIDTKGHPGVSSYPTRIGNHANNFVGDPLRVWREVTARRGVSLYAHHSGIWDNRALALHPEWGRVLANGSRDQQNASVFGPYPDALLIPQLTELAAGYQLDGAWIDGDLWRAAVDYCDAAKEAFTAATGIKQVPTSPADPNWHAWCDFHRQAYRDYANHYIAAVKQAAPDFEFCCNWAFSTQMPEEVRLGVAFTSGDICGLNCVDVARFESRMFASQGIPWDLMSWSFHSWSLGTLDPPASRKPAVQLMREAACVIAQGGGYQAVFSQSGPGNVRDGSVDLEKMRLFAEVARFCRERQEVCFKAKPVPQIAVCMSTPGAYQKWDAQGQPLYWWDKSHYGSAISWIENQYPVEVILASRLIKRLDEYPLVVIADWDYVEPAFVQAAVAYVNRGGRLLLIGSGPAELFRVTLATAAQVAPGEAPEPYSVRYHRVGQGLIGVIGKPRNLIFYGQPNTPARDFSASVLRRLFPDPVVKVAGSHAVDVSLMRTTRGELAVHFVNTSGPHRTAGIIDHIDPVGPLDVSIRCEKEPTRVRLVPGHRAVPSEYRDGRIHLRLDPVEIHDILVIQ